MCPEYFLYSKDFTWLQPKKIKYSLTDRTNTSKHGAVIIFLTSHSFPTQLMERTQNFIL